MNFSFLKKWRFEEERIAHQGINVKKNERHLIKQNYS